MNTNHERLAYRPFSPSVFEARGAKRVTTGKSLHSPNDFKIRRECILTLIFTGITGFWQPSVHRDLPSFVGVDPEGMNSPSETSHDPCACVQVIDDQVDVPVEYPATNNNPSCQDACELKDGVGME